MKKTININLGGRIFLITEDAYTKLDDYITSIRECLKHNEYGNEIADDIEARISELCDKRIQEGQESAIDLPLVNEIINRIGKPETMFGDEEEETAESSSEEKNTSNENKYEEIINKVNLNKKFYLNPDDRMIGGVVAGIAAYTNNDVTIMRVIAVALFVVTGFLSIIAYLIAWALVPVASSTTDKLRMKGVPPTPENIAQEITTKTEPQEKNEKREKKVNKNFWLMIALIACGTYLLLPNIPELVILPEISISGDIDQVIIFTVAVVLVTLIVVNWKRKK